MWLTYYLRSFQSALMSSMRGKKKSYFTMSVYSEDVVPAFVCLNVDGSKSGPLLQH